MNAITAWVRRASATTLTAVGLTAAAAFAAGNWLWSIDPVASEAPAFDDAPGARAARELSGPGPAGVTAHFRYVDSIVPTANLTPDATAGGNRLPLVGGADGRLWYADGRLRMEFQTDQGDTQLLLTGSRARCSSSRASRSTRCRRLRLPPSPSCSRP